uniref:Uncharacterized protein n=1 Tax=Knipowitschia caucasica TaxID=637954 RepID=A0AAV2IT87_KNICA
MDTSSKLVEESGGCHCHGAALLCSILCAPGGRCGGWGGGQQPERPAADSLWMCALGVKLVTITAVYRCVYSTGASVLKYL